MVEEPLGRRPILLPPEPADGGRAPGPSSDTVAETKAALPPDTKGEPSKKDEDCEPPPAYSEGSSPLESFTYLMATAGGPASIITQVQQGGPPINALGGACTFGGIFFYCSNEGLI
jgi:G patch domain-containing protein 1